jgi:rod shape determining protein RodA
MTPFLRKLLGMNWLLFAAVIAISLAGILLIHGATYLHPHERYWQMQAKWVGIGLFVFLTVTMIDYRWVKWAAVPMYLASTALVALTYTSRGVEKNGAKCWLSLPGIGVFQPSQGFSRSRFFSRTPGDGIRCCGSPARESSSARRWCSSSSSRTSA